MSNAVAIQFRDQIIEKVSNGEMLHKIAQSLGIAAPNISKHLASDPEYVQARELGAELRLHKAYERMEECAAGEIIEDEDSGEKILIERGGKLARARDAAFKAAAWFAEREFPERWGNKTQVTFRDGDLGDKLRRASERVIEGEVLSDSAVQQSQRNTENGEG